MKEINGWNCLYAENITYYKQYEDGEYKAICMFQLEDTDGNNDRWVAICGYGDTADEAIEQLDIMPWCFSDIMSKDDLAEALLNYMKDGH